MDINNPNPPINPIEIPTHTAPNPASKKRNYFLIILGVIILLLMTGGSGAYYLGMQKNQTFQEQPKKIIASPSPHLNINKSPQAATQSAGVQYENLWKPICATLNLTNLQINISWGDGTTNLARKAISQYFNNVTLSNLNETTPRLNAQESVYAEDYIRKNVSFPDLSTTKIVQIPCNIVEDATLKARATTIAQKKNLEKYGDNVSEYQINDIIQENLDKLYETNPDLKKNSGMIKIGQ